MVQSELKRQVKFEKDLDHNFYKDVAELAWGEKLLSCIQCGNCSGACPLSTYMDYTPRQIIAMVRAGFKDEVLHSKTIWLCSSCYKCTVECPKEIKITDVMYALKQLAMKEGIKPPTGFLVPVLAKEFYEQVRTNGRQSEGPLLMNVYLKSFQWFAALGQAMLGLRLFFQGRIGLQMHRIPMGTGKKGDLKKILDACDGGCNP